jgi:transcriptional antiterminator RfaH
MDNFWAVLRTQPRRELIAVRSVTARGVEAYAPRLPARENEHRVLVFPGYLFARPLHGADDMLRIRSVPGIAYVLPRGGPPAQLPDNVVHLLRRREADPPRPLQRGEKVLVLAEPFRSLEAVFDRRLSAAGRVRVLLELVHRVVPLDLNESQLRRACGTSWV